VNAEAVYVDPSALCRLYLHQPGSKPLSAWRRRIAGSLPVTHHGRAEITNAIGLSAFRGDLSKADWEEALADLDADFAEGRLHQADLLWRATLDQAAELSRVYTPQLGTRAADVLHVACALELKLKHFLTFDERQQKLATVCGLKPVKL